jgi:hypothetical protein
MMLKRYSSFVLLSVLLATAASAQDGCKQAGRQLQSARQQSQSARVANSEAATEYSTCVENQGRENCKDEYSKLQSAQNDLKTAVSGYESDRGSAIESGCVEQSGEDSRPRPFGKAPPLGVWPQEK